MGANVYLEGVAAFGYKTASAETAITQNIPPKEGKRIAIKAFGATAGTSATDIYFMQTLGTTTLKAACTTSRSIINLTAQPITGNNVAANDYLVVKLDDGTYHFSIVSSILGLSVILLTIPLSGVAAAGNTVYDLGAYGDTLTGYGGHFRWNITASTQETLALDGGFCYARAKGYPMMAYHRNNVAGSAGSIDYIMVDYINK